MRWERHDDLNVGDDVHFAREHLGGVGAVSRAIDITRHNGNGTVVIASVQYEFLVHSPIGPKSILDILEYR